MNRSPLLSALFCALGLAAVAATLAFVGGFSLSVAVPTGAEAGVKDALLVVRPIGCHEPANARISATAEGLVNGRRISKPLHLKRQKEGVHIVSREWPAEGRWVLAVSGAYRGMQSSIVVNLAPDGSMPALRERGVVKVLHRALTPADIDGALADAGQQGAARPGRTR